MLLCVAALVATGLAGPGRASAAPTAVGRPHDPVVVPGSELAEFSGVPLAELVLLVRDSGGWMAIPFQLDEVTASGDYTTTEDGLLDANDELVFMGRDAGGAAASDDWVGDAEARLHLRYTISITDPLALGDVAYAYLHRSSTLSRSPVSYVAFDEPTQLVTAVSYTMAFSPHAFIGISDLTIHGHSADILDRQKLRVTASGLLSATLNEEELLDEIGVQTVTLPIVGPVRAVSSGGMLRFAFYRSRIDMLMDIPLSEQAPPLSSLDRARLSYDWVEPAAVGMDPAVYYDSNTPTGVDADGAPDTVSLTPMIEWLQYEGSLGGAVFVLQADAGGDYLSNYYKDDGSVDVDDTGDQRSFADAGIVVDKAGDTLEDIVLTQTTYVLPPGTGNVGDQAAQWRGTPLVAAVVAESYLSNAVYVPVVLRG
jgi:hypothetical protein